MNDEARRQALGEFLRSSRARLSPTQLGLAGGKRRRTPGLRREEVAFLANISVAWYVALEQGRAIHPSTAVLQSIAHALQLSPTESQHFFVLAGQHLTRSAATVEEKVDSALQKAVMALDPHPAFVLGRRWDVLAWNRAASVVLSYDESSSERPQNLIWTHFTDPRIQEIYPDWEQSAQLMVALLRTDSALFPGDAWFAEIIENLQATSAFFRQCWSRYDLDPAGTLDGQKVMNHPLLGHLEFETITLLVPAQPSLRMILYMPPPAILSKLVAQLDFPLAEYQAPQRVSPHDLQLGLGKKRLING